MNAGYRNAMSQYAQPDPAAERTRTLHVIRRHLMERMRVWEIQASDPSRAAAFDARRDECAQILGLVDTLIKTETADALDPTGRYRASLAGISS